MLLCSLRNTAIICGIMEVHTFGVGVGTDSQFLTPNYNSGVKLVQKFTAKMLQKSFGRPVENLAPTFQPKLHP